ncbi:MAG: thioredoxin domain-containing protein [Pseudomonadota bacterium]
MNSRNENGRPPLRANHLAGEPSPYLQQHRHNPVDWYPWGAEALEKAKREDKPILLSIGYSTCHWCHVMAHECFEDEEVAAVMNRLFVNIKVDREERPDLDQIYQSAHNLLTGRAGGWPLTLFLTPDQVPFFAGTYFPKTPRYNLPGFADLMERVAGVFRTRRGDIEAQNREVLAALKETRSSAAQPDDEVLQRATHDLARAFDKVHGGFSRAPKFPRPGELEWLVREAWNGDEKARHMLLFTLEKMVRGGLFDQLGGGFFRYSVDEQWQIPHFEKMLYDNGPLLGLCADAFALSGNPLFARAVQMTVEWLAREMASPEGGFYAALDADSEGHEGRFYVWTQDEARAVLGGEYGHAARAFALDAPANFENAFWHLRLAGEPMDPQLESARQKLFAARGKRVRPHRDEKILTGWNALMIKGLAHAGRLMQRPAWIELAMRAADFIREKLWREGRLHAGYANGEARLNGYLDDYAFLLDALLELVQAHYRPEDMAWAQTIADALLENFEDKKAGGFYFTSHDHEALILRTRNAVDQATPAGAGVAAMSLVRLGRILNEPRYERAAEGTLAYHGAELAEMPAAFTTLLATLAELRRDPGLLVVRGPERELAAWKALAGRKPPAMLMFFLPDTLAGLPASLDKPASGKPAAWLCRAGACLPPFENPEEIEL